MHMIDQNEDFIADAAIQLSDMIERDAPGSIAIDVGLAPRRPADRFRRVSQIDVSQSATCVTALVDADQISDLAAMSIEMRRMECLTIVREIVESVGA